MNCTRDCNANQGRNRCPECPDIPANWRDQAAIRLQRVFGLIFGLCIAGAVLSCVFGR
jgi:hypothetical protein